MVGIVVGGLLVMGGVLLDFGSVLHVEGVDTQAAGVVAMAVGLVGVLLPPLFRSQWGHPKPARDDERYEGVDFIDDELVAEELVIVEQVLLRD